MVWATLDKKLGRAAIKSFVVPKGTPGMTLERLEHKLGIRSSDTAAFRFENCRVPKENLLGGPDVDPKQGFAGRDGDLRQHPAAGRRDGDRLRPGRPSSSPRSCSTRPASTSTTTVPRRPSRPRPRPSCSSSRTGRRRTCSTLQAAWMADNGKPNSLEASMAKAKAGRVGSDVTLRCVELAGSVGYSEHELLEKWARDSKILDIFEGTQQIQQLIVARRLLGKTSRS